MRKNKGITLIALIITIIILLILVGVSLNLVIKGDLFGSAEKAVEGTNAKVEEQQTRVDELMGELDRINEKQNEHNWKRTGDNLTCNHCNRTVTIGQELDYKDNGKWTSSIGETESGIATAKANGEDWVSSYGTQTISKDSETKWVVLGEEDSDKNGTNETLLLTTKEPTEETIVLYGVEGYNNCIDEINRMCRELYGANARSMTIDDVNNCLTYTPEGGMYYLNYICNTTGNLTTKLKDIPTWNKIKDNHQTPDGVNTEEALGKYLLNGYWYVADSTVDANTGVPVLPENTTTATKTLIFGSNNSYYYWLASRGVRAGSYFVGFGPGIVEVGNVVSCRDLFGSYAYSFDDYNSLRAVVSLRYDIPAVVE